MGIRLVVGLGNPGKEYERTRHNAGFWLVERFATSSGVALRKDAKFQALVGRVDPAGAWLLLPQTFMNRSGSPVQMLAGVFKIKPVEMLVVHDELDFPPGVARLKQGGVVNHVLNELDITCFPDDLPEYIEVDLSALSVGHSLHIRDVSMPKGVEPAIHKEDNPVVATVVVPALVVEEEVAPTVSAAEVPTTEQTAAAKEGEGDAAAKPGDKGAAPKAAEKPAAEKKEKK